MERNQPVLPDSLKQLLPLSYNLWFSWNADAVKLYEQIDPERWEKVNHNPVRMVQETSAEAWDRLASDSSYLELYSKVAAQWEQYESRKAWYGENHPEAGGTIAYFSAEFGFHESLPIYSGGLGILAGDHCKSASDLGLPFVGVGLLYRKGYFQQRLDSSGSQQALRVDYDFNQLPVRPVQIGGSDVIVEAGVGDSQVKLKVWVVQVGRIPLYLLDADLESNSPQDRELTSQLYGGNQDMRIAQEIVLGVGGVKALRALGLQPNVYHINEGHAAFLSVERMREYVHAGVPYDTALELIRASTVFTTHTPVPAGHDAFPVGMVEHYLHPLLSQLVYEKDRILGLGYDGEKDLFNMTFLAMNTASLRNGVSKLHGHVSRVMFRSFHGNIPVDDVPIGHVTNGVHMQTWLASELQQLFDRFLPGGWVERQAESAVWESLRLLPDESLLKVHSSLKAKLIDLARRSLQEQRRRNGESEERIREAGTYLNPDALTIGFARRFATYKRANLLFKDLERLNRIVNHPERPVQFIFAGKAHPADHPGQDLIREIYRVSQMDAFKGRIVILENYDMSLARYLVQGVDIWLNNPLRPLEASGTSGEKAAMNGAVNFSVLDGWWEEGYNGTNGWAIEADPHADWHTQEQQNAESLYTNLEREIAPLYYERQEGSPQWAERMKNSIGTLAPVYNTHRMVQDYTEHFYSRTIERFRLMSMDGGEQAARLAGYKKFIREHWGALAVKAVTDDPTVPAPPGNKEVKADLYLGSIRPDYVGVEIVYYAENPRGIWDPVPVPLKPEADLGDGVFRFRGQIPSHLVHIQHYSVRIRPYHPLFAHRFEVPLLFSTVK